MLTSCDQSPLMGLQVSGTKPSSSFVQPEQMAKPVTRPGGPVPEGIPQALLLPRGQQLAPSWAPGDVGHNSSSWATQCAGVRTTITCWDLPLPPEGGGQESCSLRSAGLWWQQLPGTGPRLRPANTSLL